jgi:hypothetical protein
VGKGVVERSWDLPFLWDLGHAKVIAHLRQIFKRLGCRGAVGHQFGELGERRCR